jgi:hypothetical protein
MGLQGSRFLSYFPQKTLEALHFLLALVSVFITLLLFAAKYKP